MEKEKVQKIAEMAKQFSKIKTEIEKEVLSWADELKGEYYKMNKIPDIAREMSIAELIAGLSEAEKMAYLTAYFMNYSDEDLAYIMGYGSAKNWAEYLRGFRSRHNK